MRSADLGWAVPGKWFAVFHKRTSSRWVSWLAWGVYKHVSLFGYAEVAGVWVLIEVGVRSTEIALVPDRLFDVVIPKHILDADVIEMQAGEESWPKPLYSCVPLVSHILGLSGCALRPDSLYRQCLAHGGKLIGARNDEGQNTGACPAPEAGP